jgi:hypothetical protein
MLSTFETFVFTANNQHIHKSINPDVCELRFCLRSCCFLLLLLFDSSIYLLLCNEIYIIFNNIKLKIFVAKLYLLIIFAVMVALHLFCFLHASDDFLDLARWNGVPFNDERIFQCLPRVEWMTILSNSSV